MRGLAPVYDMLPMFHAPRHGGELPRGLYDPRAERDPILPEAAEAARELWGRLAVHDAVSPELQQIAVAQAALL